MTKSELIKALAVFHDDAIVIMGDQENGWSNIGEVVNDGVCISLKPEHQPVFSN